MRWSFDAKKQPVAESSFCKLMPLWLTVGFVAALITQTKVICHRATGIHLKAQRGSEPICAVKEKHAMCRVLLFLSVFIWPTFFTLGLLTNAADPVKQPLPFCYCCVAPNQKHEYLTADRSKFSTSWYSAVDPERVNNSRPALPLWQLWGRYQCFLWVDGIGLFLKGSPL